MASEEVVTSFEAVSLNEERKSREASATSSVESATLRASSAHPLSRNGIKSAPVDHQSNKLSEGENDSGVDESTQGGGSSPRKLQSNASNLSATTSKTRSRQGKANRSRSTGRSQSVPKPFGTFGPAPPLEKKVPMNKVKVGMSSSPNLKEIKSKVGSLANTTYKPGGGEVKIESRKLEWKAGARTQAKNDGYTPKGGERKIESRKLAWNANSKIGSMANTNYKPGGGDRKIQSQKLEWKADSKVGSTKNLKHKPGGGQVKAERAAIRSQRIRPWRSTGQLNNRRKSKDQQSTHAWPTPPQTGGDNEGADEEEQEEEHDGEGGDGEEEGQEEGQEENAENEEGQDEAENGDSGNEEGEGDEVEVEVQESQPEGQDGEEQDRRDSNASVTGSQHSEKLSKSLYLSATSRKSMPLRDLNRLGPDLVQIHLQGRPVVFRITPDLRETWDPEEKMPLRDHGIGMEWIYGYRGRGSNGANIYQLPTGELVYYIAAVCVLYNPEAQTQRHYLEHTSDIVDVVVHQEWPLCVTAQTKSESDQESVGSCVHIWNYDTLQRLHTLDEFTDNVACIALSKITDKGSAILGVVENGTKTKLSLWSIGGNGDEPVSKIAPIVAASDNVHSLEFHPTDYNTLILTGKGFVTLWTLKDGPDGPTMERNQGLFTRKIPRPKSVLCSNVAKNGDLLTGDSDGNVMIWKDVKVIRVLKGAHQGSVGDICVMDDGTIISGGLSDGAFVVFDDRYQLIGAGATLPDEFGCIRRILQKTYDINEDEVRYCRLVVGTSCNCILDVSFNVSPGETEISNFEIEPIVQGHAKEVFHIADIPGQDQFLSCGEDRSVICWDAVAHKADWTLEVSETSLTALATAFDGHFAIAGSDEGKVFYIALNSENLPEKVELMDFKDGISCISMSPTEYLAIIGTDDGELHCVEIMWDSDDKANHLYDLNGHSSKVKHIDWSEDGTYLRTNSADHEVLYWEVNQRSQVTDAEELDNITDWASHTCPLDFNSLAIWTRIDDGTDINSCDASQDLLVVGDDHGFVLIYPYPATQPRSEFSLLIGHSSHVSVVRFLGDGTRLVSGGGKDSSIIQWSAGAKNSGSQGD